jgi:hypothetical protein
MPKASDVMKRASVLLLDEDNVRWPLSELADCINDAVKAIILAKPSASARTAQLPLDQGTYQKIPDTLDSVTPLQLLGVNRNIIDTVKNIGGRAIRTAARAMLDSHEPNWHNPAYVPFAKEVRQVIFDENVPLEFNCYPGNDGHGVVEISPIPEGVGSMTQKTPPCKTCKYCFDPFHAPPRPGGARCHHASRREFDPVYGLIIRGATCRQAREDQQDLCGPSGKLHEIGALRRIWRFLFGGHPND